MLWLNWRQYRWPLLLGVLLLTLLCTFYISDGLVIYSLYNKLNLATCQINGRDCYNIITFSKERIPDSNSFILLLPVLIGVFVGAPLLPLERHTTPFTRTQSVTLQRWLAVKLGLVVLVTLIFSAVLSLTYNWWENHPMSVFFAAYVDIWGNYESGMILIGRSVCDLLLGVAIGALIRRPVPAMIVAGILLLACNVGSTATWPYLIPPQSKLYPASVTDTGAWGTPGALPLSAFFADQNGREIEEISTYCGLGPEPTFPDYNHTKMEDKCIKEKHLQWEYIYQPAERYWTLQIVGTLLFFALSVALLPLIYWLWYRRLS
jgi:hypothetical protein